MKTKIYEPIYTYLKSVEFDSPNTPNMFFDTFGTANMEITLNTTTKLSDDKSIYLVELHCSVTPRINNRTIFSVKVIYSSLVRFFDNDIDEQQRDNILKIEVPQQLFNPLRSFIWNLTEKSGFPGVMLNDFNFADPLANGQDVLIEDDDDFDEDNDFDEDDFDEDDEDDIDDDLDNLDEEDDIDDDDLDDDDDDNDIDEDEEEYNDFDDDEFCCDVASDGEESTSNIYPLGYQWIIEDIQSFEEGRQYMDTVKKVIGHDIVCYTDNPIYKYFYRFLPTIEYNHPSYDECEESFWPLLLCMLFGEDRDVKILPGDNGLPEVEFRLCKNERRRVSSLSLSELKRLTSNISAKVFTGVLVDILSMPINVDYAKTLRDDVLLSKDELYKLYGCDKTSCSQKNIDLVEMIYRRIMQCDEQTLPYIFAH